MLRVETLVNKLHEQLSQKASVSQMLTTVDMLRSELAHQQNLRPDASAPSVSVHVAAAPVFPLNNPASEEKIVEVLQVDEAEMEAELEEIKRNAEARNNLGAYNKPPMSFDPVEDIPTLAHQQPVTEEPPVKKELHEILFAGENPSLNDKLKVQQGDLSESLNDSPIRDLKKGIGLNDRFLFIRELFRGDETMYERSIKTINSFSILPEAEYWIRRELKLKLAWNDQNEVVKQFDQLVRRRFA